MTAVARQASRSSVESASVERLAAQVGDAFYLLDLDEVRSAHDELLSAFRRRYPATTLAYSVKTHYTPRLLRLIHELGSMAEVVSEMEHGIAERVGFAPQRIVINGPLHSEAFLERAALAGSRIHLDGWYMLEAFERLSRRHPEHRFEVGVRLGFPLPGADWSRFGFGAEPAELERLQRWFEDHRRVELVGLHCHFPLAPQGLGSYQARLEGLLAGARHLARVARWRYLDIGGGFRRGPEGPSFEEVAASVAEGLEAAFGEESLPELLIEPGTAVVAHAVAFVCRVYDVKRVEGRDLALVNGSMHDINTMMWHQEMSVRVLKVGSGDGGERSLGEDGTFDVAGNTCMERKDLICTRVPGPVAVGDYLVFDGVGAYGCALKPPFIHTCPAMVARQGDRLEVVKRPETVDDILSTYVL